MLRPVPAMSNTERQRRFRERNPGYYGRLHAKRRAGDAAPLAVQAAVEAVAGRAEPLALPAPVEVLMFPWMSAAAPQRELEPLPASQSTGEMAGRSRAA